MTRDLPLSLLGMFAATLFIGVSVGPAAATTVTKTFSIDSSELDTLSGFYRHDNVVIQAIPKVTDLARTEDPALVQFDILDQPTKSLDASTFTASEGNLKAESKIDVSGRSTIDETVTTTITLTTEQPTKKDLARAFAEVRYVGAKIKEALVAKGLNLNIVKEGKLNQFGLDEAAKFTDPVIVAVATDTIAEVEFDVFNLTLEARNGSVGFDENELLELAIGTGGFADFSMETLVSWATDRTGDARLENGVLTVSGLLKSANLNDPLEFWDLTYLDNDPNTGFIVSATLNPAHDFDLNITMFPLLGLPPNTEIPEDIIEITLGSTAELVAVPEPSTAFLVACGLLGLCAIARRLPQGVSEFSATAKSYQLINPTTVQ